MSHHDQVRYSTATVEAYLPSVFDEDWTPPPVGRRADNSGIRTKGDPHYIPEHVISAADVSIGYRRGDLSHQEKECLRHVYHLGYSPGAIASVWGVAPEDVFLACSTGIQRITAFLNRKVTA